MTEKLTLLQSTFELLNILSPLPLKAGGNLQLNKKDCRKLRGYLTGIYKHLLKNGTGEMLIDLTGIDGINQDCTAEIEHFIKQCDGNVTITIECSLNQYNFLFFINPLSIYPGVTVNNRGENAETIINELRDL